MSLLQKIGGAVLALFALLALAAGLLTPQGQAALRALRDFGAGLLDWLQSLASQAGIGGRVAGNAPVAGLIGAGLFVLLMLAVPSARSSRGGVIASFLASVIVALIAYQPGLVGA